MPYSPFACSFIAALTLISIQLLSVSAAQAGAQCHCRNSVGERVQVGNFACLKTGEGLREARCDYVLNNTAWKFTGKTCPFAHYQPNKHNQPHGIAAIDFKKLGLKNNPLQSF